MVGFKLTRSRTLIILLFLAVLADLLSSACGIKKPQAPSWMTTWELPLANRTWSVSEILGQINYSNIKYDSNGDPFVQFDHFLDTTKVDESLKLNSDSLDFKDSLGCITVRLSDSTNSVVNLSDIMDIGLGFVPPASFETFQPLDHIGDFTWAHIEQGFLSVTFHNALEIDLDTLIITLIDSADMHQIGVLTCQDGLHYLETETQQLDISGQTISNSILMRSHGHTPGGVLINAGSQRLESTVFFPSDLTVSSGAARVQEFTHTKTGKYEIEDSTKVYSSVVYQGMLDLHVTNNTNLPNDITLHSSNFKLQGLDFSIRRTLPPHGSADATINLAGYTLTPWDGINTQSVTIEMINTMPASGPDQYTFHSSDSLNLHINVSPIYLESATGRIKPISVKIDTITQSLDLPNGLDRAGLTHASLSLTLSNNCMVSAYADLIVNGNGQVLHFSGLIPGKNAPDAPPVVTTLTPSQDELLRFFNPPPNELFIYGQGTINPDYQVVSLRRGDNVYGEVSFSSPLAFIVNDTIVIDPGISCIGLETKPRDISFGAFSADLSSHLPVGVVMTFFLGNVSDSTLFSNPATIRLGPYCLAAAFTDSNGFVSQTVTSTISDSLDAEALALFDGDSLFFGQKIMLLPTQPGGVVITGADNIKIGARARIQMLLGGN